MPVVARTPQELSAANVAHSVMDNLGFLAGSVMAGILLTTTSPEVVFALAAAAGGVSAALLVGLGRDRRPEYAASPAAAGVLAETRRARALLADPKIRVVGAGLTMLLFFEGAADVLVVILAIDLLGLDQGSVGYLNATWGIGALLGVRRPCFSSAGSWPTAWCSAASSQAPRWRPVWVVAAAHISPGWGWDRLHLRRGRRRTLLQRLGSDETLARALGFLEQGAWARRWAQSRSLG